MTFKKGDLIRRVGGDFLPVVNGSLYVVAEDQVGSTVLLDGTGSTEFSARKFVRVASPHPTSCTSAPAIDQHVPGAKLDTGKVRPSLILNGMARALYAVSEVGTFGAIKYTDGGWVHVPNGFARYEDAQQRHALARAKGETHDPESKLLHLQHEAWNALAKLDLYLREQEKAA
jgi:Domain of unknown function (DUF5664)